MAAHYENRVLRPLRVFTDGLVLDGLLNATLAGRTLDELNNSGRPMLALLSPKVMAGDWVVDEGSIVVNKAAIMMVAEIPDLGASLTGPHSEPELQKFGRAAVRMRLRSYNLEAYVVTSQGGDPLVRLSQGSHSFMALNNVKIAGPGVDLSVPFLAVNRQHVLAGQELYSVNAVPEEVAAGSGDGLP